MIQDKIYIRTYHKDGKLIREDAQSSEWHRSATQSERFTNTEYIRKDALLKWAKEKWGKAKIESETNGDDIDYGKMLAFDMVVKKIESL